MSPADEVASPDPTVGIEPLFGRPRTAAFWAELNDIFFSSSATKDFDSTEARDAFRHRWLGRYLDGDADLAFVAISRPLTADEMLVGYIVGSLEDPAQSPRFADLEYFQALADVTRSYPAQLHVNLAASWRGQGIGKRLVSALAEEVFRRGALGLHAITARGMDNQRFYEAIGFREVGTAEWNGRELVMLGLRSADVLGYRSQ
ncbi:MAG: GNAT family N-acetyltransferase [Hyphomicrobium sp.]|nr:GNAT family N-acetyltransferase [Hyphomicrobium sp.]